MIRRCDQPSLITPYLLLGDSTVNENPELVQVYGITHIINMAHKLKPNCRLMYDRCIVYEHIKSEDRLGYSIRPHFEEAFELIDHARCTGGRVLVHCKGGKSRSATIVIAYLMSRYQMPLFFAFEYVKQRRKVIQPNPSFSYALECYDQELSRLRTARGSCGGNCCYMVTAYRNLRFLEALTYSSTIPQPFFNSLRLTIKDIFGH